MFFSLSPSQLLPCAGGSAFVAAALLLVLLLGACGRAPESGRRVVAILPAEYLGSDQSHQWMANALSVALAEQVRGAQAASVFVVRDANEAAFRAANEIVRCVVSGEPSNAQLSIYRERVPARRVEVLVQRSASSPAEILVHLRDGLEAAELAGNAFSTSDGEAFSRFGKALTATSSDQAEAYLREALRADPQFTGASLRLASAFARADKKPEAEAELERLLAALPEERALERAYAQMELAGLRMDRDGLVRALEQAVLAAPADAEARNQLAQAYMQSRRFEDAARAFEALAEADPTNSNYWNQAVYAYGFARKRDDALRLITPYRNAAPRDANVDDTHGDIHFYFSDFPAAAERYEAAYQANPKMLAGFPLFKAGWAWLYAGELAKADNAVERYLGELRQSNAPLSDLRNAQWQYIRGRRQEARSAAHAMRQQVSQYGQAFASLVASQLYMWDVAEKGARGVDLRLGAPYGLAVHPSVAALAQATQPNLNSAQRASVIGEVVPAPQQPSLVALATFLDSRRTGALSPDALATFRVADGAVTESRGLVTHLLLGWALTQSGSHGEALEVFARRLPPVAEDDGLMWPIVFPHALLWEQEASKQAGTPSSIEKLDALVNVLAGPRGG